jgi:hypothetical protein
MSKYLVAAIWPLGLVIIAAIAFLLARRDLGKAPASPDSGTGRGGREAGRHHSRGGQRDIGAAVAGSCQVGVLAAIGAVVVFGLMCLLGLLVVNHGLSIDRPVFNFMSTHHVHAMKALMDRLTKIGDTWTCWGAAVAAAICLTVTWRDKRWLPAAALASAIVIDHYTTSSLRHVFHRLGPPTSPLGTYPSGGCDRCIIFFGLIAYLLWREFSGRRSTAIAAGAVVAGLGFNEAFSRVYLSLHWFTDALSGLVYGGLLLLAFVLAIRFVAGPTPSSRAGQAASGLPVGASASEGSYP